MKVLRVSEFLEVVNSVLKETLSGDALAVEGEVSGYRVSQGQWVSFDLKDETALVNVFIPLWSLNVPVEDGMRVRVFGTPRIYAKYGKFSLSADRIEFAGDGTLRKALAMLRARLEKEGMFDVTRKRPLPRFPQRIALIASRESAAYGDFIRVLGERWSGLDIDLYHVLVQGERAPQDIVRAIEQAQDGSYDALVMTRGGGSLEELMAFNDEKVVRAIHASRIPTLVAIGHERDITLAEEASDVRGSTPTDCARRLVPDKRDVLFEISSTTDHISTRLTMQFERYANLIDRALTAPEAWITARKTALDRLSMECSNGVRQWLKALTETLQSRVRLLSSLGPQAVLSRGYSILRDEAGKTVTTASELRMDEAVRISLKDGEVGAKITHVGKKTKKQQNLFELPISDSLNA